MTADNRLLHLEPVLSVPLCTGPHAGKAQLFGSNRKVLGTAGIKDPIPSRGEKSFGPLSAQQGKN